ncbi:MAG: DnaJ domain-containing protein [Cyanobacterium sp.]
MTGLDKYYQILKIESGASVEEIKKAYRQLAKKWHPDNFNDSPEKAELAEEKFLEIHGAYEILKNHKDSYHDHNKNVNNSQKSVFVRRSLDNNKKKADFYYNLGVEEAEHEEWEEAIRYFTHAIKLDKDFIDAYYYRGAVLEKQGLKLRAESDWSRADFLKSFEQNKVEFNYYQNNSKKKNKVRYTSKNRFNNSIKKKQANLFVWFSISFSFILIAFGLAFVNYSESRRDNNQGLNYFLDDQKIFTLINN